MDDFHSVSLWQFLTSDMKLMTMGLAHDGPKTPWVYRKQDTQNEKLRPGWDSNPRHQLLDWIIAIHGLPLCQLSYPGSYPSPGPNLIF